MEAIMVEFRGWNINDEQAHEFQRLWDEVNMIIRCAYVPDPEDPEEAAIARLAQEICDEIDNEVLEYVISAADEELRFDNAMKVVE